MGDLVGIANSKLLLFGEYAAVFGYQALGICLPWQLRLTVKNKSNKSLSYGKDLSENLAKLLSEFSLNLNIKICSQVPIGLGFGSSASLCVAVEQALNSEKTSNAKELKHVWYAAHQREKLFHGNPSGADTGLVVHKGLGIISWPDSELEKSNPVRVPLYNSIFTSEKLYLVVGSVPRSGNTGIHVSRIKREQGSGDSKLQLILKNLGLLSRYASKILTGKREFAVELGALANEAQSFLSEIGVCDSYQDSLLEAGRVAGATGGKMSGSGGGGAFFLVCPNKPVAEQVFEVISESAILAAQIQVYGSEVTVLSETPRTCSVSYWSK